MLRLCLDLNIWVAALLADRKGRNNTAAQYLVEVIRSGSDTFVNRDTQIEIPDRYAIYYSSAHNVQIVHPYLMVEWLRSGDLPKISFRYPL